MIIGVTGSRNPRPERVVSALRQRLIALGAAELHFGDCVGFDAQAYEVATELGLRTVAHPPDNDALRAWCAALIILPAKPYLERNRAIVNAVDFLVAAPDGPEALRSGTWSTIRYAKKVGKRGVILQ